MFTQCAKCETVFRLSAETLRAAGGQVRCGRCGEVFNALARLAEEASSFPAGESALEMEARADEILQSAPQPAIDEASEPSLEADDLDTADVDIARLQVLDKLDDPLPAAKAPLDAMAPAAKEPIAARTADPLESSMSPDGDSSLEFTLPPGELDRIFVEPAPQTRQPAPAATNTPSGAGTASAREHVVEDAPDPAIHRGDGMQVSEEIRREMLAGIAERPLPDLPAHAPTLPFVLWLGAAIVLAVTLAGQVIRDNREWFAAHAPLRGPLSGVYAALGVAVQVPANLSAYQLRQWGVTGDPSAAGTLRVRASILNTAAQLQPYPLLRVTLANRFGTRIGSRDFEPAEYLGKPTVRMLAPGERADATLDILDPGKEAEGFEIDVCLRGTDQKISCAADVAPQTQQ